MKSRIVGLVVVAFCVMLSLPTLAADQSDLAGRVKAWEAAFNRGDDKAVAALYTQDCARLAYQAETLEGREGVMAGLQATREVGGVKIKITIVDAESSGTMTWGQGTYKLMAEDGSVVQEGKWLSVSVKSGKEWLIHRDIWNTNAPE